MRWYGKALALSLGALGAVAGTIACAQNLVTQADRDLLRTAAFEAVQQTQLTSAAGAALTQVGARFAANRNALGEVVRRRQDLVERWAKLDRLVHGANQTAAGAMRSEQDAASASIKELDQKLEAEFPEYAELTSPRPVSESEIRTLLREDEALILVFASSNNSYVWAITKTAADWTRVDMPEADVAAKVALLRKTLDPHGQTRSADSGFADEGELATGPRSFNRSEAYALYARFLQPLEPVWRGKKLLNLVVSGPLSSLPFALLLTAPPQGEDGDEAAMRRSPWLIRTHALVTLPTVSGLRALRRIGKDAPGAMSFRGFGAPRLADAGTQRGAVRSAGSYFRGALADVAAVRSLPSLPETEGELTSLAAALGSDGQSIAVGAAATETAVKQADLSQTRVIAFATHGLVAGDLQGLTEPALVFTPPQTATAEDDGLLTASEAAQLKLSADWVILSACNTAAGDGSSGAEGLSGLARAFFYAGAKALLVSHWPVLDSAAARLTTGTLAQLQREPDIGRAEALRRSMVKLMDDESDPAFAQPLAWAPFVVVGDGQ